MTARDRWALAAWLTLIAGCWLAGTLLNDQGVEIMLGAPPFYGRWDVRLGAAVLGPVAIAAVVVYAAPTVLRRASWPQLLLLVAAAALAFELSLTLIDGIDEIEAPLGRPTQYINTVPDIGASPGAFLSSFIDRIDAYPSHVRAHPPAMVLGLWGLDRIGLGGTGPAAVLILLAGVSTAPAALIALRHVAGEDAARRAAPYFGLSVMALSMATTYDALYMAVGTWSITALILATDATGRRAHVLGAVGGLLFGVAIFCSYGLVLLGAVPLAYAVWRRRVSGLVYLAAGSLAVTAAFAAAGFWWLDGFNATRIEYRESVARTRPYAFFVFNNLAVTAMFVGPAVAVALARLRDRRIWLLVGGGLAMVALADVSGMSKAEVERIWLPFMPWIVLATAALPGGWLRPALGAHAALAIAVCVGVDTLN